jgi:NTE family protein
MTPHTPRATCSPRTAFVLSGGASLGALQVGMLRALYERGIAADLIVGTSVGALNAAFVATRPQTVETADALATVWRGLARQDIFPIGLRCFAGWLSRRREYVIPDRGLRRLATRHLELGVLEQARVPLHLVAFDLISGREVRLSSGPAIEAVLAASAVPAILPPVRWGGQRLIDGGVVNNTPISHAVELGAERVYVLGAQRRPAGLERPPRGALEAATYALGLLTAARLQGDIDRYSRDVELIVLPAANPGRVQPTDFEHSSRLIADSLAAARTVLAATVATSEPLAA